MNADEDYGFDVAGFLHLPQVLTSAEVEACNKAIDAAVREEDMFQQLQQHPVLQSYLESLCGPDFALDQSPSIVANASDKAEVVLKDHDPERNRRLRYVNYSETRTCHGVRIMWALAPTPTEGDIVLVPASHTRSTTPPAGFLNGDIDLGMTEEILLQPGDLLICAATLLHGVRGRPGRLVEMEFVNATVMPSAGPARIDPPDWTKELTPEQLAIVGIRTSGRGGKVVSDGERCRAATIVEQPATVVSGLDEGAVPDPDELWFWDVRGYLVLRGVMDEEWLAAAHGAIDMALEAQDDLPDGHLTKLEDVAEQALRENNWVWPEDTSPRLYGEINRPRMGGLYQLPKPHCDPFRKMIAHPAVVQRLNWMLGYGYMESTEPMCCIYPKGTSGGSLHGQNPRSYTALNGRPHVPQVNVAWALNEEIAGFGEGSGGFICIPGSHKASYLMPRGLTTSIDLPQVRKPALNPGDVLFFSTITHGTTTWRSDWNRRTTIQFMNPANVALKPGNTVGDWCWSNDPNNPVTNTIPWNES
jgi:ectoine hydroxylase-related dioxygenase (phytanoyl-CoA dioxygenase family)